MPGNMQSITSGYTDAGTWEIAHYLFENVRILGGYFDDKTAERF
jgi:hypothetical protein